MLCEGNRSIQGALIQGRAPPPKNILQINASPETEVDDFDHHVLFGCGTLFNSSSIRNSDFLLEVLLPTSVSTRVLALVVKRTSNKSVERRFLGSVGVRDP